jgi:DNA-binding transcriptional regulator WhiA
MATDAAVMQPSGSRTHPLYVVRVRQGGETLARQTGLLDSRKRPVRGLPNKLTTSPAGDLAGCFPRHRIDQRTRPIRGHRNCCTHR